MARITHISVTYGRKINLGDYNSAHFEMTLWAELDDTDTDPSLVHDDLWEQAKASVKAEALPIVKKQMASTTGVFAGLPVDVQDAIEEGR